MIFVLVSIAVCLPWPSFARAAKDVLVMKNGDRITCEVKSLDAGVLKVNLDYVDGTISIDWLQVSRLESSYLFLVQLQDGSIYSGKVINAETLPDTPVRLEIQPEAGQSVVVDKLSVVRITQTSESFFQRFSGEITLGATYSKGNNATQYNIGSELEYQQTRWGGRLTYNSNLSANSGAMTATRNQVDLNTYRLISRQNYFVSSLGGFLQSSVQGIQVQTSLGAGLGRYLKNTERVRFWVLGGIGWQGTHYLQAAKSQPAQNVGVALISSNLDAFVFKKTRLNFSLNAAPSVTEPGRYFLKTNASYYLKLFGKIDWNFSYYGSWDTRPPPGFVGSDYGTSTGLSYTFGNK
jgi:hypothetical protein